MFITTLTSRNFRYFGKDAKPINLNGLSAFMGWNGSGKTAILEASNFLIEQEYLSIRLSEKHTRGKRALVRSAKKSLIFLKWKPTILPLGTRAEKLPQKFAKCLARSTIELNSENKINRE